MIHSHGSQNVVKALPRDASLRRLFLTSRLWTGLKAILLLQFLGSAGYFVLGRLHLHGALTPKLEEAWGVLDCIYMTVITISTIGYGEVFRIPDGAHYNDFLVVRGYTIVLVMVAMIFVAYSVSSATAFLVHGDLQRLFQRRRAMKEISRLSGHYILCGHGVTGEVILEELLASGHTVVVIDSHPETLECLLDRDDVLTLRGDATDDGSLLDAGIERAAGVAAALPNDKDNLFLIISIKQLNPSVRVASLATDMAMCGKLQRAGADAVVSASFIGGMRLASELARPAVVGFLDLMLRQSGSAVRFAEVSVGKAWAGKTVGDLDTHAKEGLPVLAVREGSAPFVFNPSDATVLTEGMDVVTMGETDRVQQLVRRIGDGTAPVFAGEDPTQSEA